jgi:hypothetical protein
MLPFGFFISGLGFVLMRNSHFFSHGTVEFTGWCCLARARDDARTDSDYVAVFLNSISDRGTELNKLADLRVTFSMNWALF